MYHRYIACARKSLSHFIDFRRKLVSRVFMALKQKNIENGCLYEPLQAIPPSETNENVTPMVEAGTLSKLTFWWLNPLMIKGKTKVLDNKDIPKLRREDTAKECYSRFMETMKKRRASGGRGDSDPSILSTLFVWQCKEVVITGFFSLIKVLALASGPLILRAFIRVFQGKESFEHEGYFLALGLLLAKCLESVSERQLKFGSRVIGLQVKSMLCAAIYQKQLRLSNDAKLSYSSGQIMNYATVDATRIGEFPFWFHRDRRLKGITEAVTNMKVLKLYAWETHFREVAGKLRNQEMRWLSAVISQRGVYLALYWSSPAVVAVVTFWSCYLLGIPLDAGNVFTFLATIRIIQEPIQSIPDVAAVFIEASVALARVVKFLEAPELQKEGTSHVTMEDDQDLSVIIKCERISWNDDSSKPTLTHVNLEVSTGKKVAICGEVGSGKSTLISAILGEVEVYGKVAYVSQTAWIQTGTIRENILFGMLMDEEKYEKVVTQCSLMKDIEMFPFGDQTIIGERGINLSGGQKQRVQLARALYQDADIYLLDDPFSAVDAHTASSLFKEYIMDALSSKTVLLVTHQVDFLPAFDDILLMVDGKIVQRGTYEKLLASCREFKNLMITLRDTSNSNNQEAHDDSQHGFKALFQETKKINPKEEIVGEQLLKQEEKEAGDTGFKPYKQYLSQSNGVFYFSMLVLINFVYIIGQVLQNLWLAKEVHSFGVNHRNMLLVYTILAFLVIVLLFSRSYLAVKLGVKTSITMFIKLITSLFRAPMAFYDSTPIGRIISPVS
ncbi:unnamed protein product [Lactuca virosa]|uniref:ABC-type xenobiotic transporter n=1 Tax=Lactuca virosa TaxID=75947 RepID=A0AAU9LDI3_9ASTR|nr:unnamed protein product [Lactuca virosa]